MAYAKLMPRRGTLYDWSTVNPVLEEGEFVIEVPDSGVGTGLSKMKIGDGVTPYNSLPYAFDGAAASSIDGGSPTTFNIIQFRRASAAVWEAENPILNIGEPGYDTTNHAVKFGDGATRWKNLSYEKAMVIRSYSANTNCLDSQVLMDFGDEDAVSVSNAERSIKDNSDYPENILPDGWNADRNGGVDTIPMGVSIAGMNELLSDEEEDLSGIDEDITPESTNSDTSTNK